MKVIEIISKVDLIAATLDKGTCCGVAYTVIVIYFWWEGTIHCVQNELKVITSTDGDGEGSAVMLALSLMNTLHLSKVSLSKKLCHLTYDGVYADSSERTRGGGGLSLVAHLEEFLLVELGTITGTWDAGHKMQLAFGDVFQVSTRLRLTQKLMK